MGRMLEAQCLKGDTRKMALLTILSLIELKPACRWHALHLLFKLAYRAGEDSSIRFDTIRLVINKIYSSGHHAPMRWQMPHLSDEDAAAVSGSDGATVGSDDCIPLKMLRGRYVEDVATLMLRSMAPPGAQFTFPVCVPQYVDRLCIKRPFLLHALVETFTLCGAEMKEHLINSIEEAIKCIPASEPELLVLVQKA